MLSSEYRDRIHIRRDIILKLAEYGQLNQTKLYAYCGLNLEKHKDIIKDLEEKQIVIKKEILRGKQKIILFSVTGKGLEFCKMILDPYEEMFPRKNT